MKNRCEGCGAKIQTIDNKKPGYIKSEVYLKNPDNFLCERCFNLKHYNRLNDCEVDSDSFAKAIDTIAKSGGLVVNVVDAFDLEGTFIDKINKFFPKNDIILVVNKFDLFLSSTKISKVRKYVVDYLNEKKIRVKDICIMSGKKDTDVKTLIKKIDRLLNPDPKVQQDVYFFGVANVGKSTIINALMRVLTGEVEKITISNLPGTTLDFVKMKLQDKVYIYDTPGIINKDQFTYYLSKETLNLIIPQKYVKPKTYQLMPQQCLFVGNFIIIQFLSGEKLNFTLSFSNAIPIHRTKLTNLDNIKNNHRFDILKYPTEDELIKITALGEKEYDFSIDGKMEVAIGGLGFFSANGSGKIKVVAPSAIKVSLRSPLI